MSTNIPLGTPSPDEQKPVRKARKPRTDDGIPAYKGVRSIEDLIRANNAHLQVLLKTQAKLVALLIEITAFCQNRSAELVTDDPVGQQKYKAKATALTTELEEVQTKLLHADVHQTYLATLLDEYGS